MNLETASSTELVSTELPLVKARTFYNLTQDFLGTLVGLAPNSIRDYKFALELFEAFLQQRIPTSEIWIAYLQHLCKEGYAPWYLRKLSGRVKVFFKWCKEMKYIKDNPTDVTFRLPPIRQGPRKTISYEEYLKVKEHCYGTIGMRIWPVIVMGYSTGANFKDIAFLKRSDVNMTSMTVKFIRHKMINRAGRECTIKFEHGSDLHQLFEKAFGYKDDPDAEYLFPDLMRTYRDKGHSFIGMYVKKIFHRAGIKDRTFKTFRNTMCTDLLYSGVDVVTICQITGHSSPTQLLAYVKPDEEAIREAMSKRMNYARRFEKVEPPTTNGTESL